MLYKEDHLTIQSRIDTTPPITELASMIWLIGKFLLICEIAWGARHMPIFVLIVPLGLVYLIYESSRF